MSPYSVAVALFVSCLVALERLPCLCHVSLLYRGCPVCGMSGYSVAVALFVACLVTL